MGAEIAAYREAIRVRPNDPSLAEAYYQLGEALAHQGEWREAIDIYHALARIKPDDSRVKRSLGETHRVLGLRLFEKGELNEAIEQLGMTLRFDPANEEAKRALADTLLRRLHHFVRVVIADILRLSSGPRVAFGMTAGLPVCSGPRQRPSACCRVDWDRPQSLSCQSLDSSDEDNFIKIPGH